MYQRNSRGRGKGGFKTREQIIEDRFNKKYQFASSSQAKKTEPKKAEGKFIPYQAEKRNSGFGENRRSFQGPSGNRGFSSSNENRSESRPYQPSGERRGSGFGESRPFQKNEGGFRKFSNSNYRGNGRPTRRKPEKKAFGLDYSLYIKKAVAADVRAYVAKHKFADFNIVEELKRNIAAHGYVTPTPIQDQSIPFVLEGKDVIGMANTGTGKTAAFILPLINKIYNKRSERVLIIAPTRELASQIDEELWKFAKGLQMFSVQVIGGANMNMQIGKLRRRPQFIIGTPGRLNDLIRRGKLNLSDVSNVVLDEVDRMVDMGFIEDIQTIFSMLPEKRQSLFFSATIPPKVEGLMKSFLTEPVKVAIKSAPTSDNVDQDIVKVERGQQKIEVLHELLAKEEFEKVLVFGRTKKGVEDLSVELNSRGFNATSIHGDKPQSKREKALRLFKQNRINILVATDVAARGLDIDSVSHVINYDLPENYDDYVHRIGRTGRADKKGVALTFVK